MNMQELDYELVGYDCPLGSYPSPLVPIVRDYNGKYKAVYLDEDLQLHTDPVVETPKFYKLSDCDDNVRKKLEQFDYRKHRLFALSESNVDFYKDEDETDFFKKLLNDKNFSKDNPFARVSLAEATGSIDLLDRELRTYEEYLKEYKPNWLLFWEQDKKAFEEKIKQAKDIICKADIFYDGLTQQEKIVVKHILLNLVHSGKGKRISSNCIKRIDCLNEVKESLLKFDFVKDRMMQQQEAPQISSSLSIVNKEKTNEVDDPQNELSRSNPKKQNVEHSEGNEKVQALDPTSDCLLQQSKLNLPIHLPENVFQELVEKCQELVTSTHLLGVKLVKAIESLFPDDHQDIDDLASYVLRPNFRSADSRSEKIKDDYFDLELRQKKVVLLMTAKELFENMLPQQFIQSLVERTLNKLIQAKLVRLVEGDIPVDAQIELFHDALLYNWSHLVDWSNESNKEHRTLQPESLHEEALLSSDLDEVKTELQPESLHEEALLSSDLDEVKTEFPKTSENLIKQLDPEKLVIQKKNHLKLKQVLDSKDHTVATPLPLEDYRLGREGEGERGRGGEEIASVILHPEGSNHYHLFTNKIYYCASIITKFLILMIIIANSIVVYKQFNQIKTQNSKIETLEQKVKNFSENLEEQPRINKCYEFTALKKDKYIIFERNFSSKEKNMLIWNLQFRLKELNFLESNKEIDGYWGPITQNAFIKFTRNFDSICNVK